MDITILNLTDNCFSKAMNTIIMLPTVKVLCEVCIAQGFAEYILVWSCRIHTSHSMAFLLMSHNREYTCSDEGCPLIEYHVNSVFRIVECITCNYFEYFF